MARSTGKSSKRVRRAHNTHGVRRKARSNPRGVLEVTPAGYGFVKTSEGELFIPRGKMSGAFDGDLVELALLPPRERGGKAAVGGDGPRAEERRVARVLRVIDRAHDVIIGRYEVAEPFGVVVPEDPRIQYDVFTRRADNPDVPDGVLVRVRVTEFPTRHTAATGVIEEVLGEAEDGRFDIDLIIARHKLETVFSDASMAQAAQARVDEEGALRAGYRDLRDRTVVTIDPADARDFDDALSLDRVGGLWRLGVHIADVSHYVPWDSSLDLDARRRATSVYLVDRVIPMLPEALSNDICSLAPGETRRAITVDLYVNDRAELQSCETYPSLICSNARLTYDEVQEVLQAHDSRAALPRNVAAPFADMLALLSNLAKKRDEQRKRAGGLDFDSREARVRLDAEGRAIDIDIREKTDATQLVEEAMIFANEVVASRMVQAGHPCLYRVHEQPQPDALGGLIPVLQEFDWFASMDEYAVVAGNPHAIQAILQACAGRPEGDLVSSLVLRAMQRAVYSPLCDGHYGLASAVYCHFTSPIRRYPDLVVHRMVKRCLCSQYVPGVLGVPNARGGKAGDAAVPRAERDALQWLAEHSSEMERIAEKAARESQERKMMEYLQDFIGQTFSAVISGVTTYGLYVRLDNTAEGMVPMRELGNEYFALDPVRYVLTGTETGRQFRLGSRIAVVLKETNPLTFSKAQ